MRSYLVFITCEDGTRAVMSGRFKNDWAAIDNGLAMFENAVTAIPRRVEVH